MTKDDDDLIALTSAELTADQIVAFEQEITREFNDRGAAILIVTNLETTLEYALTIRLKITPQSCAFVFQNEGPLSDFCNKIKMATAIGMIGPETKRTLDKIRRIRNAFAHAKRPIDFSTPAIAKTCALLAIPQLLPPMRSGANKIDPSISGRERFRAICERVSHNILVANPTGTVTISHPVLDSVQVAVNFQSLP